MVMVLLVVSLAFPQQLVSAQDPTPSPTATLEPTPTSTPAYMQDVSLTSGNILHVERTITYGDAALVVVGMLLWITLVLSQAVQIARNLVRR